MDDRLGDVEDGPEVIRAVNVTVFSIVEHMDVTNVMRFLLLDSVVIFEKLSTYLCLLFLMFYITTYSYELYFYNCVIHCLQCSN